MPILVLANTTMPKINNPTNNINLPNLNLGQAQVSGSPGNYSISTPWAGNYVESLYSWAMGIIFILAALTIAIGGVIWVTAAGNQGRIKEAKSWIGSSLLGVSLALSAYLILTTINPDLGGVGWISVGYIEPVDPGGYNYSTVQGYSNSPYAQGKTGAPFNLPNGGFPVPQQRDMNSIVDFYLHKTNIQYVKATDPEIRLKRGKVYQGTAYSDCSDFAARIASVGGYNKIDGEGTTRGLFINGNNNRQLVTDVNTLESHLNVGDVVGYNNGHIGHVMTYIGNGRLIECGGDSRNSIIEQNGSIKVVDLKKRLSQYRKTQLYYINR